LIQYGEYVTKQKRKEFLKLCSVVSVVDHFTINEVPAATSHLWTVDRLVQTPSSSPFQVQGFRVLHLAHCENTECKRRRNGEIKRKRKNEGMQWEVTGSDKSENETKRKEINIFFV